MLLLYYRLTFKLTVILIWSWTKRYFPSSQLPVKNSSKQRGHQVTSITCKQPTNKPSDSLRSRRSRCHFKKRVHTLTIAEIFLSPKMHAVHRRGVWCHVEDLTVLHPLALTSAKGHRNDRQKCDCCSWKFYLKAIHKNVLLWKTTEVNVSKSRCHLLNQDYVGLCI